MMLLELLQERASVCDFSGKSISKEIIAFGYPADETKKRTRKGVIFK
ncbi:hypothetical protein [Halanaerobium sp. ST460_2HS_T2]|nr:hypothetical protein [Halanaerobium sp. ST460_2HS_T2]RCW52115.1 hypothetical protein DFR80_13627 [Halanaerobium sp. ST460_2HS_T2]